MSSSVLINHENLFNKATRHPTIVNDFAITTKEDKEAFVQKLLTTYDETPYNLIPNVRGKLKGKFRLGEICLYVTMRSPRVFFEKSNQYCGYSRYRRPQHLSLQSCGS